MKMTMLIPSKWRWTRNLEIRMNERIGYMFEVDRICTVLPCKMGQPCGFLKSKGLKLFIAEFK